MNKLHEWFFSLFYLLSSQEGAIDPKDSKEEEENTEEDEEKGKSEEENEEENEEDSTEESEDEDEDEDGDEDSGKNLGKDRSKFIPRKRFDKVNARAQRLDELLEAGVLVEDEEGNVKVAVRKSVTEEEEGSNGSKGAKDFYFSKDDVDDGSWPLVQKINKGFQYMENLAGRMAYVLNSLQAEHAVIRDYPEFLQKESPLRKKALAILKEDPEFKKKYRGDPEKGYWAVKRAFELLKSNKKPNDQKKPKSRFIVGKGDSGKTGKKTVPIGSLTSAQLDELEKSEHERLSKLRSSPAKT